MTKTLTEQWREGTLPDGIYYVKDLDGTINWFGAQNKILWRDLNNPIYASERIEVLAPVPSYDEYKKLDKIISDAVTNQGDCQQIVEDNLNREIERLQEQLAIATKALEEYEEIEIHDLVDSQVIALKAIKEMEGVK